MQNSDSGSIQWIAFSDEMFPKRVAEFTKYYFLVRFGGWEKRPESEEGQGSIIIDSLNLVHKFLSEWYLEVL